MQRDGATVSLWQYNIPDYETKHTTLPAALFDVIIAGGGITGITTALLLQKSGKNCLLLESNTLGFGTTGGTTAHLNTLLDTPYNTIAKDFGEKNAQLVAKAAQDALNLISNNISTYNIKCEYQTQAAYLFSQNSQQDKELDEMFRATAHAGVQVSYVNEIPIPISFTKAFKAEGQGKFHPIEYLFALAKQFEEAGGTVLQHCRVTNWHDDENVTVETTLGKVEGRKLIFATHIPPGVSVLHLRCAPYRSYAIAVELNDENYPDHLTYDLYNPYHYYRTQEVMGKKYFIAGGEDHKTGHVENTEACFLKLEAYVRKYFNVKEMAFKWSSQYYEPADGLPYIGHMPGSQKGNIYAATGFSGNGMTWSHVAALVLCDMLTGVPSPYEELFSPGRIKPVAGFTAFVKENVDVAKEFVKGFFTRDKIESLSDLAHGEGKVANYEGEKIALYKDENGQLHAVSPVCRHLKCHVAWNIAEQSWDCPCHGARYNYNGKVITGPASTNLEQINIE
ncbi:FAD-dependent oxidoreductase [Ilyomonas limi]|uniref:FAD-dependent oxidoreductase n=1 Tax=Ilyomonas limi TaxID=2575867 RepID=A0A4U3KQ15_9BACT|nr:FAD-dependent oxidoreductase [Ilyomonas limi]TKK64328.1 FAD-dependent oxidoreductase [Ilyomonas limi]